MTSNNTITQLLHSEVSSIQNPNNVLEVYAFKHIDELANVLLTFLDFDCKEPIIAEAGHKIINALSAFSSGVLDVEKLPSAIEDLSTGFESFLKKIAVIRYESDHLRLHGDGVNYAGLLQTPLGGLLEGRVAKLKKNDKSVSDLLAPLVTFTYAESNTRETVYNHARNLRNKIHNAPKHSLLELMQFFRLVTAAYLFATEENLLAIRCKIDPLFSYLSTIRESFKKWEHKYIELLGEEKRNILLDNWPNLQALEWRDEADDNVVVPWDDELLSANPQSTTSPLRDSIQELSDAYQLMWLVGEAGAGKTTTLKRLAWSRADELLKSGYLTKPLPVFISANLIDSKHTLRKIVSELVKVEVEDIDKLARDGNLWLLLDAINEIASSEQDDVHRDIQNWLLEYDESSIILTSRKFGFKNFLDIPVFEVLPLTNEMIHDFLLRHLPTKTDAENLFDQLTGSENLLLDFARSPLMLRMLTQVVKDGKPPSNRGQLFWLFMNWIFSRERKTKQTETSIKEKCLSEIAFGTRQRRQTSAHETLVLNWIKKTLINLNYPVNSNLLFTEFLENHILELDTNKNVSFFHELGLEYFAAVRLCESYVLEPQSIRPYLLEWQWFESIVMLSGLLESADDLVVEASTVNLILAARCIASGAKVSQEAKYKVVRACAQKLAGNKKSKIDATTALLELGTVDAFRLLVKILTKESEEFPLTESLSRCSRPEMAAIKLLKFGLTRRHRIYQCLKALQSKVISQAIINSPEIAEAQKCLLDGSPDVRYIELVNSIGVSSSIAPWFSDKIANLLETIPLASRIWRTAVHVAIGNLPVEIVLQVINKRIIELDSLSQPESYYSFLYACQCLAASKTESISNDIALKVARLCLKRKLFGLAVKFIEIFDIRNKLSINDLDMESVQRAAKDGSISVLIDLSKTFVQIDFQQFLETAVENQLAKGNIQIIIQNLNELEPILYGKAEKARKALIVAAPKMKAKTIKNCIGIFGLESAFRNAGKITTFHSDKGYGFITDLTTGEALFFRKSSLIRARLKPEPEIGQIVYFGNVKNAPDSYDFRVATTILVDLDVIEHEGLETLAMQGQLSILLTVASFILHIDFTHYIDVAVEQQLSKGNLAIIVQHSEQLHSSIQSKSDLIKGVLGRLSPSMSLRYLSNYIKKMGLEGKFTNCARICIHYSDKHYGFMADIQTGEVLYFHDNAVNNVETKSLLQVGRIIQYDSIENDPQHLRRRAIGLVTL